MSDRWVDAWQWLAIAMVSNNRAVVHIARKEQTMSRWVCIDDICIPSDENDWEELVAFADAIAEQEPIEIIRCGECKYQRNDLCDKWSYSHCVKPYDFCSYGVKKGADDE